MCAQDGGGNRPSQQTKRARFLAPLVWLPLGSMMEPGALAGVGRSTHDACPKREAREKACRAAMPPWAAPRFLIAKHPVGPLVGGPARTPGAAIGHTTGVERPIHATFPKG